MKGRTIMGSLTEGAPTWSPGPDRDWYLPEESYFVDTPGFPLEVAARVTAQSVARWADRYQAYSLVRPSERREGVVPDDPMAREALVETVFDWLETQPESERIPVFNLYAGSAPLLDQSDGVPGIMAISQGQFAELQQAWERHGLPRDLYYQASEQRIVVEPAELLGGVVRLPQRYSPLRWARRSQGEVDIPSAPGEEERKKRFVEACGQFQQALLLRLYELGEPEPYGDADERDKLHRLMKELTQAMHRAMGIHLRTPEG